MAAFGARVEHDGAEAGQLVPLERTLAEIPRLGCQLIGKTGLPAGGIIRQCGTVVFYFFPYVKFLIVPLVDSLPPSWVVVDGRGRIKEGRMTVAERSNLGSQLRGELVVRWVTKTECNRRKEVRKRKLTKR